MGGCFVRVGRCVSVIMQTSNVGIEHGSRHVEVSLRQIFLDLVDSGLWWFQPDLASARGLWNICRPSSTFRFSEAVICYVDRDTVGISLCTSMTFRSTSMTFRPPILQAFVLNKFASSRRGPRDGKELSSRHTVGACRRKKTSTPLRI